MENICFPLKPDNNTGHGLPLLFITRAIAKIAKSPLMVGTPVTSHWRSEWTYSNVKEESDPNPDE